MGATYTRQSSFTDGDVITADLFNNEYDQLLAAFASSTGHTHDGTAAEGGPITKLLGNTITFGAGTSGTDITITFDGETNDGELKWMEDEDYFEFSDDILIASTEKLQFRDTAIYLNSSTDGQLDIVADTLVQVATAAFTVDASGDITLDAGGADVVLKDDGTQYGALTNTSGNLIIKSGTTTAMTFSGANVTFAGTVTIGSAEISEAELEILDGATVTTTELNIMDGDTSATSTTVADADRVVFNDAGTMKQVAVTDLAAYFDDEITAMPNLVTTAATTVGALDSGSITSGFGTIDTGSSNITTTGVGSFGSLDISGDIDVDGTTNLDVVDIDGAVDMASTLQVDGAITSSAGATITTADNTAQLTLRSTDTDANVGPVLDLNRNVTGADNDNLGSITFSAQDDAGNAQTFAKIDTSIRDASNSTEASRLNFHVASNGSETKFLGFIGQTASSGAEITFNEDSNDIDFRVETNAEANAFVIDAGAETATFGVPVTANDGVSIDNITIDGTEIDLSSGNLTVDVSGNIILDADGGDVELHDGGTKIGQFALNNSGFFDIFSAVSDADIRIRGNDGGSTVTALTLDMSDAGAATFNAGATFSGNVGIGTSSITTGTLGSSNKFL